jgi:hypothetical protein
MNTAQSYTTERVSGKARFKAAGPLKWVFTAGCLVFIVLLTGRLNLYLQFSGEVAKLLANSRDISSRRFAYVQLEGLPRPVQQYFRHVLREGQPYISNVHLFHNGTFKADMKKDWIDIRGEAYFSADRPGFVWKGKTAAFTARDMFIEGKGRLVVSLFSLFKVEDSQGTRYNRGELMRWLGESVCFPTNLLPSKALAWSAIDDYSARLEYNYQGMMLNYIVFFNDAHEITQMHATRNMGDGPRQKWVTKLSKYQQRNSVLIPTVLEAGWQLKEGYFPYAKFTISQIDYNRQI